MKTSSILETVVDLFPDSGELLAADEPGFTLKITIKRGNVVGGGLPNGLHVITSIGDDVVHKTPDVQAPYYFNETITKVFDTLEPVVPVIISFAMYKKRWTSPGYKLVGTIQFPLSDLRGIRNKGSVEKQFTLISNRRNITLHGSLVLSLSLTEIESTGESQSENAGDAQKRNLSAASVFGRISAAASQKNWTGCIMLCLLDDTTALLKLASEYDNANFGNVIKLAAVLCVALFLAVNYLRWVQAQTLLGDIEQELESIKTLLRI